MRSIVGSEGCTLRSLPTRLTSFIHLGRCCMRSAIRYALPATLAVALVLAGTIAFGHDVTSTNSLSSATPQGSSNKVIVTGTFTPGSEPAFGVDCGPAAGRAIRVVDQTTSTSFGTSQSTTVGGAYSTKTATPNQGKFTSGTHSVHTVIQGAVGGPYGATHPCLDAISNSQSVTIP